MAVTYKGVEATKVLANLPSLQEQGKYAGKLMQMYDTFVLTADLAAGDIIKMGSPIREGARLVNCRITTGALGGSCTIDVGWAASAQLDSAGAAVEAAASTGIFAALPVSSATVASARGNTYEGASIFQKVLAAAVQIQVAEHAVSSGATGLAISIELDYIVD